VDNVDNVVDKSVSRAVSTENVILKAAIKKAVLAVASADCDEWFACTGYCQ
jgi:hypothetical protein